MEVSEMKNQNQHSHSVDILHQKIRENIEIKNTLEKALFLNQRQIILSQLGLLEAIEI